MFDRRNFLKLVGAGLAGAALDPDRLLWRPGAKTISIPPAPKIVAPEGISIRILRAYDLFTDRYHTRMDAFFGAVPLDEIADHVYVETMTVEEYERRYPRIEERLLLDELERRELHGRLMPAPLQTLPHEKFE